MKLSQVVSAYMANNVGSMLDEQQVGKQLMRAVRLYAGHASIAALLPATPMQVTDDIAAHDFELTTGELAIVTPLFNLYCEHANATMLEASRGLGIDVFGRSSSEVLGDIKEQELALPRLCFSIMPELI